MDWRSDDTGQHSLDAHEFTNEFLIFEILICVTTVPLSETLYGGDQSSLLFQFRDPLVEL